MIRFKIVNCTIITKICDGRIYSLHLRCCVFIDGVIVIVVIIVTAQRRVVRNEKLFTARLYELENRNKTIILEIRY